jgi:hypothetical protein
VGHSVPPLIFILHYFVLRVLLATLFGHFFIARPIRVQISILGRRCHDGGLAPGGEALNELLIGRAHP